MSKLTGLQWKLKRLHRVLESAVAEIKQIEDEIRRLADGAGGVACSGSAKLQHNINAEGLFDRLGKEQRT
jgi:hypothetical protein